MGIRARRFLDYEGFVEKFKPKLTTDECYTPPKVYEAIKNWACGRYGIDGARIVRPFYPGGDFLVAEYPAGCVVLDNPPFSILARIRDFYLDKGIDFFLFAPALTAMSHLRTAEIRAKMCVIQADGDIIYENGAAEGGLPA